MVDEVETAVEQTPVTPQVEEHKEFKEKKGKDNSLVLLLLVMVFSLLGLFAYLFFTDRLILGIDNPLSGKKNTVIDQEEEPNEEDEVVDNPTDDMEDEKIPLITHTNTTLWPYKLKYPQDWEITKENTSCDDTSEICTFHELEITYTKDPQYAFYLHNCSECGPNPAYCAYSDVTYPSEMLVGMLSDVYYDNYTPIDGGTFRRSFNPSSDNNSDFYSEYNVRICERGESEQYGVYYVWGGITAGDIAYKAPSNADENILKVMDNILLSLEELPR